MKTFTWTVLVVLTVFSVQTIVICRAQHTHHSFRSRDSVHDSKDASFFSKTNQINQLIKSSIQRWTPYLNLTRSSIDSRRTVRNSLGISPKNLNNLVVAGLLLYGTLASFAPEKMNEISRHFALEDRQGVQNIITSGLVGVSESLMGWVEKSVDDLPSLPRLDAQECMKRCICEAHNQPKKYGLIGLGLQLFFPPYTETDEPSRIVSKYQLAARYGRQDNANCAAQYDDCMVNVLDVVQGVFNVIF